MDRVAKLEDIAEKVRAMTEALQNTGHLLASGFFAPFVVDGGHVAFCVCVFNELNFGSVLGHQSVRSAITGLYHEQIQVQTILSVDM